MSTRRERAEIVRRMLEEREQAVTIPLDHRDPFTLLTAALLSAQCTDKRVNQVTPKLFAVAATPAEMASLPQDQLVEIIRPCGLANTKARHLIALSRQLIAKHNGIIPGNFSALERLPGVGHKTASVLMLHAFGHPAFPVDTHIHRLAQRWGLTSGRSVKQTERDLKTLFPRKDWGRIHLQMIYYGRECCTARGCNGTVCAICRACYPKRTTAMKTRKA